jgi:hypothetical protein
VTRKGIEPVREVEEATLVAGVLGMPVTTEYVPLDFGEHLDAVVRDLDRNRQGVAAVRGLVVEIAHLPESHAAAFGLADAVDVVRTLYPACSAFPVVRELLSNAAKHGPTTNKAARFPAAGWKSAACVEFTRRKARVHVGGSCHVDAEHLYARLVFEHRDGRIEERELRQMEIVALLERAIDELRAFRAARGLG